MSPRIRNLVVSVDDEGHGSEVDEKSTDVYDGELTTEGHVFSVAFEPTRKEIEQCAGSVGIRVSYVEQDGYNKNDSRILQVQFRFEAFEKIENPYNETGDKAIGNLFVGRAVELREIVDALSVGKGGRCFVLYGQRRSGKSSILEKLNDEKAIAHFAPDRFVYTTIDAFLWHETPGEEYSLLWEFARNIDRQLKTDFKRPHLVKGEEISWITDVSRQITEGGRSWIIGIDEFTRPYLDWRQEKVGYIDRQRISSFLKALRSLLGEHLFHLVILGQECMLQYEDEFPNEFAVTTNRRLSYLNPCETLQLIEDPIRRVSIKSRFASKGVADRYLALTGGYPYYAQIICYQIVRVMNDLKCTLIDDVILDRVLKILCEGSERLRGRDFDPFIDLLHPDFTISQTARFYYDFVKNSQDGLVSIDRYKKDDGVGFCPLFRLMMDRDILEKVSDRSVRIRSGLFEHWLSKNEGMVG